MLKFFRLYNKYILVAGVALLMVVFLIQPAMQMFRPSPSEQVIGKIDGQPITARDRESASVELLVLGHMPLLGQLTGDDPLRWLLMVRDARQMGLSASDAQVNNLLQQLGINGKFYDLIRHQARGVTQTFVEQAVRHWLMVQDYQELVLGQAHIPPATRLQRLAMAQQFARQGNLQGAYYFLSMTAGSPRISEPLIRHFLANQRTRVSGKVVLLDAKRYLDQAPAPSDQQLQALFDKYKDDLPGQSTPYGFGYRFPERVRIEYLTFPIAQIQQHVTIDEAQALAYYQAHQQQFTSPPLPPADDKKTPPVEPKVKPYVDVREQIIQKLRKQKADELGREMVKAARAALLEQEAVRRMPESGGYKQIPTDYQPEAIEQVAAIIEKKYDFKPTVWHFVDQWKPVASLDELPGLSQAHLASRPDVTLIEYVHSAKQMNPKPSNPLTPLRLQVGLPSEAIQSFDGSFALFRLTAAQPEQSPANLDKVRTQVTHDAKLLAAYQMLLDQKDKWVGIAKTKGFDALAKQAHESIITVPPTPRRSLGRGTTVSTVRGIGASEQFLDAMFDVGARVSKAAKAGKTTISKLPIDQRLGATGVPEKLGLAVFKVDGFEPITTDQYQMLAQSPGLGSALRQTMLATKDEINPLSLKAIERRVGYVAVEQRQENGNAAPTGPSATKPIKPLL